MGEIDTVFLAKERLLMNVLSKYGPVLTSVETSEVLNCPRGQLHLIPMTALHRLIKYGVTGGIRYFALDIVNYLIPGGVKKLNDDLIYEHLFERYGAVVKTRELAEILRGTKLETYNISESDLPMLPRIDNGAMRYMLHDVVSFMTNKMFTSERPQIKDGQRSKRGAKSSLSASAVKSDGGVNHVQP